MIGVTAQFASYGAEFLLVWIVINRFQTIQGWLPDQVIFLYGLNLCSYALAGFFFFSINSGLPLMIKEGTFDEILTKPLNSFLYLSCREFNTGYLSHLILSIFVIGLAFQRLQLELTFVGFVYLVLVLLGGALIQGAGLIITAVPSFWFTESRGIRELLFFQAKNFIRYPLSIYHGFIQILLTLILPYAFINFYPAQYFLKKQDFGFFSPVFQFVTPIVGLVLFTLAYGFWRVGIRSYQGTGS
ncbi:ABC transporter permease [Paenibacillus oralis]|uniref:ABC transporter permease n=1 Tax=Paenibacillus oralis TaxID=2490856 RepID=UPI001C499C54|nr:ABC-2 family transporter protein [Paenibacillus oralis]